MKLSVALCTYNGGSYLEPQLRSIVDQSYFPDEIVISDDGSTDGTRRRLESFAAEYPDTVTLLDCDDQLGVTKNFEKCIDACSGSVIALADQDDIWNETKLEKQIAAYESSDARLVCHDSELFVEGPGASQQTLWQTIYKGHEPRSALDPRAAIEEILHRNFVQGATVLFDASLRSVALPIPRCWNHDAYLALWAALTGGIVDMGDTLLRYRLHEQQDIGVARGIYQKVKRELQYSEDHFRALSERWDPLLDRIATLDTDQLVVNEAWLRRAIVRRRRFDRLRAQVHAANDPPMRRLRALRRLVATGGYSEFGHPGFVCTDGLSLVRNTLTRGSQ